MTAVPGEQAAPESPPEARRNPPGYFSGGIISFAQIRPIVYNGMAGRWFRVKPRPAPLVSQA